MVERTVSWEFIFVAAVLAGTIMVGMFFMGQELSEQKVNALQHQLDQFSRNQRAQDLSRQMALTLPEKNCAALNIAVQHTITDVKDLQDKVATYEQSRKLKNSEFRDLKQRYMNLLLEYWITTKQVEETCGSNVTKILYIYEDPDVCPRCADQGVVLTHYRQKYEDRLLVFPLDASLGMRPINLIVDAYNIETYPALIISGGKYAGFKNKEELGTILDSYIQGNATGEVS